MEERVWIYIDGNGSYLTIIDECHEHLARCELDGTPMTCFPGLEDEIKRVATHAATDQRSNLDSGTWIEAFINTGGNVG